MVFIEVYKSQSRISDGISKLKCSSFEVPDKLINDRTTQGKEKVNDVKNFNKVSVRLVCNLAKCFWLICSNTEKDFQKNFLVEKLIFLVSKHFYLSIEIDKILLERFFFNKNLTRLRQMVFDRENSQNLKSEIFKTNFKKYEIKKKRFLFHIVWLKAHPVFIAHSVPIWAKLFFLRFWPEHKTQNTKHKRQNTTTNLYTFVV